ncbi:MAG: energy-coupling factor transporter transmembrane protein EcfT [Chthoniobacterales bacterium]|nr:energy-coupling factor transporter transmembrane protein EcfT [Chthoniobacterales bacterium]MCX7713888.1 energy-coupling factor transporter transmembrane protein EcfT [Chthoniobacterales bacterium]
MANSFKYTPHPLAGLSFLAGWCGIILSTPPPTALAASIGCLLFAIPSLSPRQLRSALLAASIFFVIITSFHFLFDTRGKTILFHISWPISRPFTLDSLQQGSIQATKFLAILALGSSTPKFIPPDSLARSIAILFPKFGTLIFLTLATLPRLLSNSERILLAYKFCLPHHPLTSFRILLSTKLWLALLDQTLADAVQTSLSLHCRGFGLSPRTSAYPPPFHPSHFLFLISPLLAISLLLIPLPKIQFLDKFIYLIITLLPSLPKLSSSHTFTH